MCIWCGMGIEQRHPITSVAQELCDFGQGPSSLSFTSFFCRGNWFIEADSIRKSKEHLCSRGETSPDMRQHPHLGPFLISNHYWIRELCSAKTAPESMSFQALTPSLPGLKGLFLSASSHSGQGSLLDSLTATLLPAYSLLLDTVVLLTPLCSAPYQSC